jgi:hypothetical protein
MNKGSAIDIIKGTRHCMVLDTLLLKDQQKMDYYLKSGTIKMGLNEPIVIDTARQYEQTDLYFDGEFGKFSNYRFMVPVPGKTYFPSEQKINVEALIIQGNKKLDFEHLAKCIEFKEIIVDGSVPYWKRNKIIEVAEKQSIPYFDVRESGAYIKDFNY